MNQETNTSKEQHIVSNPSGSEYSYFPTDILENVIYPYLSFVEELEIRHLVFGQECSDEDVGIRLSATKRIRQALIDIVGKEWWTEKLLPEMLKSCAAIAGSWPLEVLMRGTLPEWKSNDIDMFIPIHPESHHSTTLCWLSTDESARLRRCKEGLGPSNFQTSMELMFHNQPNSIYSTGDYHASIRYDPEWGNKNDGIAFVRNYWLRSNNNEDIDNNDCNLSVDDFLQLAHHVRGGERQSFSRGDDKKQSIDILNSRCRRLQVVQIMTEEWKDKFVIPRWVNSTFDLDICKVAFTGTTVHFYSNRSLYDLFVRRVCDYRCRDRYTGAWDRRKLESSDKRYEERGAKYSARGFDLIDGNKKRKFEEENEEETKETIKKKTK